MVVTPTPLTNELLDEMSGQGDPVADEVIRRQFEWLRDRPDVPAIQQPVDYVRALATHMRFPEGPTPSPYDDYLRRDEARLPAWATGPEAEEADARSTAFFRSHSLHIGSALFCGSLPAAYASPRGARVLVLTGELVKGPVRRVAETAQFLYDVMAVDGLERGGPGYEDIQRVRTMHAAVRNLIQRDPGVPRSHFHPPPPSGWCDAWGVPINQEDLLGALCTFTVTVLDVLDKLGVESDPVDVEAYMWRWSVIGHLMGIRSDILPLRREEATAAAALIRARQCAPSADGRCLTDALRTSLESSLPLTIADGLIPATMRWYVGDEVADLLEVRTNVWSRVLTGPVAWLSDLASPDERRLARLGAGWGARATRCYRWVTRRIGGAALQSFLDANRSDDGEVPFALPSELAARRRRDSPAAFRLHRWWPSGRRSGTAHHVGGRGRRGCGAGT